MNKNRPDPGDKNIIGKVTIGNNGQNINKLFREIGLNWSGNNG